MVSGIRTDECPQFTETEERSLCEQMRLGRQAREQLILSCLPWALNYVRRFNLGTMDQDEVNALAMGALVDAVDQYDPKRGRLTTCVALYIRRDVHASRLDGLIRIPGSAKYPNRHKPPSQLVQERATQAQQPTAEVGNLELEDTHCGDPAELAAIRIDREVGLARVREAAAAVLTKREWEVVLRRIHGETLRAVGLRLGISQEGVRGIQLRALAKLKQYLGIPTESS